MKSIKIILSLLALLAIFSVTKPASALPAWCYQYEATDNFDSSNGWNLWNNSLFGMIIVGPANGYGARSGNTAAVMQFPSFEPSGNFLIIDKVFNSSSDINPNLTVRFNNRGCSQNIPPTPVTKVLFCSANVWIKPINGVQGSLQFLATDYTYLANTSFNLPASTTWQKVSITNSLNCQNSMIVRLGITKSSFSSGFVADDLDIEWSY